MAGRDQLNTARAVPPALRADVEYPMRGRDHEVDQILAAVRAGAARESRLCFVEGPPGAGKTRLLRKAVSAALGHRFGVVANLAPLVSRPPGASTSTLSVLHTQPSTEQDQLSTEQDQLSGSCSMDLAELPRWLDEWDRDTTVGPPGPVLVTIDDLHDCPPGTGRMLSALAARPRAYPVTWLLSSVTGPGDIELSHPVSSPESGYTHLQLGPLDEDAVATLATDVLGATPRPAVLSLAAHAGGNSALLVNLLEGLREEDQLIVGHDAADVVSPVRLPHRVRALVNRRTDQLAPSARQLVRVAAALGPTVSPHELAAMLGESFAALIPSIEAVLDSYLLVCAGQRLAFSSELVWWAVAESTPSSVWHALRVEANVRANRAAALTSVPDDDTAGLDTAPLPTIHARVFGPNTPFQRAIRRPAQRSAEPTRHPSSGPDRADHPGWASLSESERTVSYLVSEGLTNRQIASRLFLSPHTVNYHLRQIFRKLDIKSRVELARYGAYHHAHHEPRDHARPRVRNPQHRDDGSRRTVAPKRPPRLAAADGPASSRR